MRLGKVITIIAIVILSISTLSIRFGLCAPTGDCNITYFQTIPYGLGVQITSATLVSAGDGLPKYCLVKGNFLPEEDPFVVKLPTDWNGNYFQVGNGGLAGSITDSSVNF